MDNFKLNEIKIEVTHNCPLACVHCSSNASPQHSLSLTVEKCIEIIDDAVSLGAKELALSGGEPLVWNGILEAVAHSKKKGLLTSIYTSGNCKNLPALLQKLSDIGLDKLIFSIYSNEAKEHNRVTRKADSFNNTIAAIKLAQSYKIQAEIHFVALASNYKKLSDIAEFAKANGVDKVSVLRFVPQGRGALIKDKDTLNKAQNIELKEMIIDLRNKGFNIRTGSPFNVLFLNEHPKCMAAQDRLIVSPDLNIYPCDAFKQINCETISPGDNYSNLCSYSLSDCWKHSGYFEAVRNAILSTPSEPCQSCIKQNECLSGCLAQKYIYHSSLNKNPDPACLFRSVAQ